MVDRFRNWKEKLYAGWCVFRAQCKYWWLSQKKWQKALWIILLLLWLGLLIFSFRTSIIFILSIERTFWKRYAFGNVQDNRRT